jgi:hypothetical protein
MLFFFVLIFANNMVTHTLNLESTTLDQDVLCVTTVLPSYLFVFHLNRLLRLSLVRSKEDLKAENSADRFAVYEYDCDVMQQSWRVVENQIVSATPSGQIGLFEETEQRSLLFAGLSQTDLLVCVNGITDNLVKRIQSIRRVMSCSLLPTKRNKIKEKLTF